MSKRVGIIEKLYVKFPVIAFDAVSIPLAWSLAYWLRYNLHFVPEVLASVHALYALCILTVVQLTCYYYFKVYRGLWRFSSLNDVVRILRAVISATVLSIFIFYLSSLLSYIPRAVLPLYSIILVTMLCGGRLLLRVYWDRHGQKKAEARETKRVLVIGAGQAGESLIRDLKRSQIYHPIGLIDDSLSKRGLEVHGVRVLGTLKQLQVLVHEHEIDLIFIAIPSARSAVMRRIVSYCERCQVPFRTLPSIHALVSGRVQINALREVNIEDLLGRDQVEIHWDSIRHTIQEQCVLVTGGGGSIGSELCRQILRLSPKKLIILEHNEYNLFKIEQELKKSHPHISIELALANVVDVVAVNHIFQSFQPDLVFHAAAYKHVPMLEDQIRVAIQNNVLGTKHVAEASVAVGVKKFILISTDKAVNPTNVMGSTKRVAEIYCQNLNTRVTTQFITVRFGNVLGSVGSVVPLFQQQLQKGGPLTVTHPEIERYFMTISEACQLILQAMTNGQGGEIFVLDMGLPIKIRYLAEQMIRLAGKEPGKDIIIEYTGLRPGEKLYEELFHASEELVETAHEKLFKARFRKIDWQQLLESMQMLAQACDAYQCDELLVIVKSLVPEFSSELGLV